jgi:hypothetical protein
MRRMSLVSRDADGVFIVGHDHLKRATLLDERVSRRYPLVASVASYWTLDEQVQALGPTRLDRVLAGEAALLQGEGAFARQYASALQRRRLFLMANWVIAVIGIVLRALPSNAANSFSNSSAVGRRSRSSERPIAPIWTRAVLASRTLSVSTDMPCIAEACVSTAR